VPEPAGEHLIQRFATGVSGATVNGSRVIHLETDDTLAASALEDWAMARSMSSL
jgi:hypothetical protein